MKAKVGGRVRVRVSARVWSLLQLTGRTYQVEVRVGVR